MKHLLDELNVPFECDVPLAPYLWYGVGGPAEIFARPRSVQQLSALAARCREREIPVRVLGRGANLLVADAGVSGVVVRLDDPAFRQCHLEENRARVGAGFDLSKLVLQTARQGLSGLACLAGIPASVGGAVRMNAGGAYGDIGQAVRRVQVMDQSGQVYTRDREDLVFGYRHTNIVARYILEVEFELEAAEPESLMKRVKEIFFYKKNTQPLASDSAGCAFRNPPAEAFGSGEILSAGALIDRAGMKGYRVGAARVSSVHANFIVTEPGATAADVIAVMEAVRARVAERFGIELEREVVVWS